MADDKTEAQIAELNCTRRGHYTDWCRKHGAPWPYDERVCNEGLRRMGYLPRRFLGDGRAAGEPNLPSGTR